MLKKFISSDGTITTIEITEEGKVTYSVGKKKTTFDLTDCDFITYEFKTTGESLTITEDMLSGTDEIEPWMWLVISKGEERLEYNNNQTETRRHYSYSDQNDKFDTLLIQDDPLDHVLTLFENDDLREAIKSIEPKQQELIKDIFYKELSMADIARRDGVSKMAITNRMNKIIKKLRSILKNFD